MLEMMVETLLSNAVAGMQPEHKSALRKVDEFLPMIDQFLKTIPLDKTKHEYGVSYHIQLEMENKEHCIKLYQCVMASNPQVNGGKPYVSRTLGSWNVTEKIREISKS